MNDTSEPDAPEEIISTGVAQEDQLVARAAGAETATAAAPRRRRGQGRRVTLVRQPGGNYNIWMQSRHIQGFCDEWEDVTNFQLPNGIEQQVRINVEPVGEAREIRPEYDGRGADLAVAEEAPAPLIGGSRPENNLMGMFMELPPHQRELIERQIVANHQDMVAGHRDRIQDQLERNLENLQSNADGPALRSIAHPTPLDQVVSSLEARIREMHTALTVVRELQNTAGR